MEEVGADEHDGRLRGSHDGAPASNAEAFDKKLAEIGWDVPVLEGYRCAIGVAKSLVDLGVDASGLAFPGERPAKWRRKKVF